ncbi:hypothetical protein ACFL4O_03590, partial [bacterium]
SLENVLNSYDVLELNKRKQNKNLTDYYLYLKNLLTINNIKLHTDSHNDLLSYFKYLDHLEKLNTYSQLKEIHNLTITIKKELAHTNSYLIDLIDTATHLNILSKIINNKAGDYDIKKWIQHKNRFYKVAEKIFTKHEFKKLAKLQKAEIDMLNFYKLAEKRNEIITANMMRHIFQEAGSRRQEADDKITPPSPSLVSARNKELSGILIVGGYHTSGIANILKSKGISYKVIQPAIDMYNKDVKNIYIKRLNEQAEIILNQDNKLSFD